MAVVLPLKDFHTEYIPVCSVLYNNVANLKERKEKEKLEEGVRKPGGGRRGGG